MTTTPNTPLPHTIYHLFDSDLVEDFLNTPLPKLITWLQESIYHDFLPETDNEYTDSKAVLDYYETIVMTDTTIGSFIDLEEMLNKYGYSDTIPGMLDTGIPKSA